MRQRLLIFGALISLILLLIGLNAASYVQKQKVPDNEFAPNRSSYNAGTTGTQALYSLLSETGRKVVRWQEAPDGLKTASSKNKPAVFVVIGRTKRSFTEVEAVDLYQWVYEGGRLVIADRESAENLIRTVGNWKITIAPDDSDPMVYGIDPADQAQITNGVVAAKPVQAGIYNSQVNGVQPSRMAATIEIERLKARSDTTGERSGSPVPLPPPGRATPPRATATPYDEEPYYEDDEEYTEPSNRQANMPANKTTKANSTPERFTVKGGGTAPPVQLRGPAPKTPDPDLYEEESYDAPPPPPPPATKGRSGPGSGTGDMSVISEPAPVVYLTNDKKAVLIDIAYGKGKIVYLSDPYILSNAGISLVDNAQLAVNILGTSGGLVAFDEYHQGYGTNNNRLFQYFAGTPVVAIFVQCVILVGFLFFSQSRRFARAVPVPEPNRLSKLEYVSAMAELQARTRAFDLAIENIYTDFRRRASRLVGFDNYTTTRREMSILIAERAKMDPNDVEDVLFKCEDIVHGEPTNKKEILALIGRLRAIEEKLGMKRTGRNKI